MSTPARIPAVETAAKPVAAVAPRYLTIPQSAAYTATTVWYIRCRIWDGTLNARRAGKRFVIACEELDRFMATLESA